MGTKGDVFDMSEVDDLLAQLSEEQLQELNEDFDSENSLLPASQRCKYNVEKEPTGPFNRKKLIKFLETQAKNEKDWEQNRAYVKETKGKIFKQKERKDENPFSIFEDGDEGGVSQTEFDDILQQATDEELVDLAAVLGFYSIMNQDQYNASLENREVEGSFTGVAKATKYKLMPMEPPNDTDVEASLDQLESNDSKLTELNINNIKNISTERLGAICDALKSNTSLKKLSMANTAMTDTVGKKLVAALPGNKTLSHLNVESNFLSGEILCALLEAVNQNQTLCELRITNQRARTLGVRTEMRIAELVEGNESLHVLGMSFDVASARIRTQAALQRNRDKVRGERKGAKK